MNFLSVLAKTLDEVVVEGASWKAGMESQDIFLLGNGGSASIASHICNDIIKNELAAAYVPDYATLTCLANDYGWDRAFGEWLNQVSRPERSTLVLISSSGKSKNLINAARFEFKRIITFTGFDSDNPIRKLGHTNYYVPSHNYGIVECAHLAILHSIVNPGEL